MSAIVPNTGSLANDALALAILATALVVAWWISRLTSWGPAGPIALIAGAPLVPRFPLVASLTSDDLLPLLGLALLVWQRPRINLTADRLLRVLLVVIGIATLARVASALVNGGDLEGTVLMLVQAVARPVVLVATAAYVAVAAPTHRRILMVATAVAVVATFEAVFGLIAFAVPLPHNAGMEASRQLTSLYDVCRGRISGTLGLSPNHVGAVFVIGLPLTIGLAGRQIDWRRWLWTAAAAAQGAALVLTFTRSSILLGAALSIGILLYRRMFIELVAIGVLMAATVFGAFAMGCTHSSKPGVPANPGTVFGGRLTDDTDRLALWYSASLIMLDHPAFGIGLGRMNEVVAANPSRYRVTPYGVATSSAHNTVLLAGAETGILGALATLGANICLGLLALRMAWRGRRHKDVLLVGAAFAVLGFLAQGMVNNLFTVPAATAVFALVVGGFAGAGGPAEPYTRAAPDQMRAGKDP